MDPRITPALASVAGAIVVFDQLSKWSLAAALGRERISARIDVMGDWLALEYAENPGAAFGLFADAGSALAIASLAIIVGLLGNTHRAERPPLWQSIAVGAVLGGAIGNLLDRVRLGYVVDFISIGAWPNFNVADSAITIGVVALAWGWLRSDPQILTRRAD